MGRQLLKRGFILRKIFAPFGRKLFPFRADPFSEGTKCAGNQTESHKTTSKYFLENIYCISYPLEPGPSKSNKTACAASEDSNQPARLRRLIRVFSVRLKTL